MTLPRETRRNIYEYLCSWVDKRKKVDLSGGGDSKPFHVALLPDHILPSSGFERSFSTGLGTTFEAVGAMVAETRFPTVERQYKKSGFIPINCIQEIDKITANLDRTRGVVDHRVNVRRLVSLVEQDSSVKESRDVTTDLYMRDRDGTETYFEIKSPQPNKGQCLTMTRTHLLIHCIRRKAFPDVRTYVGMAYHPYGEGQPYKAHFAAAYLDTKHHVLLGRAFWDYLGGTGAYGDVLSIYQEVGRVKADLIRAKTGIVMEVEGQGHLTDYTITR